MTNHYHEGLHLDLYNKKHAYLGMCKVTILLFIFGLLSYGASLAADKILYSENSYFQKALVELLKLIGVENVLAISEARSIISSNAFSEFVNMLFTVCTMLLPVIIFAKWAKLSWEDCFPIKGKTVRHFWLVYGTMQLFVIFAGMFSTGIYDFIFPESTVDPGGFTDFSGTQFDIYSFILRIISICIFVPIVEEYIFRGVILKYLRNHGTVFAVLASSAIFGIAHGNPAQSVYALTFGIFSAFLVVVTGNIKTSIIFHSINNFTSIINEQLIAYIPDDIFTIINCMVNVITLLLGFAGLYIIAKKDGLCMKFFEICNIESTSRKHYPGMKQIFVFPFVFYVIFYALEIILANFLMGEGL